jgi:hypothetical protein
MIAGECPVCGRIYVKPRRARITIERDLEDTYLIAKRGLFHPHRRIVHECHPDAPGAGGDGTPVPARPPQSPPSREDAIALDLPESAKISAICVIDQR